MKIIKMGNLSVARNTCPYCDCEYEYNNADLYNGSELTIQYAYVICPCCGQINRINALPPQKNYPPFPPLTCFGDISNHIPYIDELCQQSMEENHKYWNPDLKEDKKDGDV